MLSIFNKWKSSSKLVKWSSIIILLIIISLTIFLPIYFLVITKSDNNNNSITKYDEVKRLSCPERMHGVFSILRNENSTFDLSTKELKVKFDDKCNCVVATYYDAPNYKNWETKGKLQEPCNCEDTNKYCIEYLNNLINESKTQNKKICGRASFKTDCMYLYPSSNFIGRGSIDSISISPTNNNEFIFKFKEIDNFINTIENIFPVDMQFALECDKYEIDGLCITDLNNKN